MKLYEYAVLFEGEKHPDDKGGGWKRPPALLVFERVIANDETEVQIKAARAIPDQHTEELDRITIAVRPF